MIIGMKMAIETKASGQHEKGGKASQSRQHAINVCVRKPERYFNVNSSLNVVY